MSVIHDRQIQSRTRGPAIQKMTNSHIVATGVRANYDLSLSCSIHTYDQPPQHIMLMLMLSLTIISNTAISIGALKLGNEDENPNLHHSLPEQ